MTILGNKCQLVQLLMTAIVVTVAADDVCREMCHVIYEVDNQTYTQTYQSYHSMLSVLPHNIVSLTLPERCQVLALKQNELQHFSKLQRLWLRLCDIRVNIYGSVFVGLINLTHLTLDFSHFNGEIQPEIFEPIQQLQTLKILPHNDSPKQIIDIVAMLHYLQNLQHLSLSTYTTMEPIIIKKQLIHRPSIISLDFSYNKWKTMPCLPIFPNLRNLNLSGNYIREIYLQKYCLETKNISIDLTNNSIHSIHKRDFENYKNVRLISLDFSNTKLSQLGKKALDHLRKRQTAIGTLTIGHNTDIQYAPQFFAKLFIQLEKVKIHSLALFGKTVELKQTDYHFPISTSMTRFSLTYAKIPIILKNSFSKLTNLEFLDLSHNEIMDIRPKAFTGLENLQTLIFTGDKPQTVIGMKSLLNNLNEMKQLKNLLMNKMGRWQVDTTRLELTGLTNLEYLDLSDNDIQMNLKFVVSKAKIVKANNILCKCQQLPCVNLEQNSQIQVLEVRNSLGCISSLTNQTVYSNLLTLDASQNANFSLDSQLVNIQMPRLKTLRLSNNNIEQLNNKTFAKVLELQCIDLSFNKLTLIKQGVFSKLISLKDLKLNNNRISNIDANNFNRLVYLKSLYLYQNSFDCNCELRQLRDWLKKEEQLQVKVDTCKYPTRLRHASIDTFHLNWIDCDGHIYIVITTSAAGLILLITLLLALTYYRLDIKYWYFFKYKYRNRKPTENNMYDAMVCYHVDDVLWIKDNLMPQLEEGKEHQFRLCVHHRDFDVGEFIKQNIINSMNNSSKIIFVMTRKFMDSEWGQFELEMALMRLPEVKCQYVIMVMLEKIPKKQLKAKLRCFTRHLTYIEWPLGDNIGQRERDHFWKKLILAMMEDKQTTSEDENTPLLQQ